MNFNIACIIVYCILVFILSAFTLMILHWYIYPHCKFIKKYVGSFETNKEYTLLGIYGFTDKEIKSKIEYLKSCGIYYDGRYSSLCEVTKFPKYLNPNNIY